MRGSGPEALPVNFRYSDGAVVFRTEDATARAIVGSAAFEVDHIDEAMSEGWSVLVKGHAHLVEEPEEARKLASLGLDPWAGGFRHSLVVVTPRQVTGRVIVQRQAPENASSHHQQWQQREAHHESTRVSRTGIQGLGGRA
jgi:nitroimidazol reductase NimA-like FMN-containing flavoprotein (pyridoxamine 5'-phosphate oxidase superfamily)